MSTAPSPRFPAEPWSVTEPEFRPGDYRLIEGIFALANGYLGQRASFEEGCGGVEHLRGNYVAGLFDAYPFAGMIKLKGRPAEPRQMVNIPDHLPLIVCLDGTPVDLATCTVDSFRRTLHLDRGVLTRDVTLRTPQGRRLALSFTRFLSRPRRHLAATRVAVTALGWSGEIEFLSEIRGNAHNASGTAHVQEIVAVDDGAAGWHGLRGVTTRTGIRLALLAAETVPGAVLASRTEYEESARTSRRLCRCALRDGETVALERITAVASSRDADVASDPAEFARTALAGAARLGWAALLAEHEAAWHALWAGIELEIAERDGAGALTQGLRYSIFQTLQNAPHNDPTVSIGAKGLTGEHYYGTYFWDTEAFILPMLGLVQPAAARDLVRFRARTLPGARAKAAEVGLAGAMYPFMADADGNESCTLWQFGLMGVHVTAAVAWGAWFHYCVTGDLDTVADGGIDVAVETARFWLSRVYRRPETGEHEINRVLGPDEYHQAVDNNYYTNAMARENLLLPGRLLERLRTERPAAHAAALARLQLTADELGQFAEVAGHIRLPCDAARGIHLQDDSFLRLEPYELRAQPPGAALNVVWSYDRILRTQLLRQGDVLVACLLLGDRFTRDEIARDFDFYEPKTTHDSSLSFCHHAILAAQLRRREQAYDYFLRTARLDLDDLHGNAWMGVHSACLAGAWQCVVFGFAGLRWYDGRLTLDPLLPAQWSGYTFSVCWHGARLTVTVRPGEVELRTDGGAIELELGGHACRATARPTRCAHAT